MYIQRFQAKPRLNFDLDYPPNVPDVGHFSTLRSRMHDAATLQAALQALEIPVQIDGEVRGSNGQRHPAEIVAVLEGRFDLGFSRSEDGSFKIIVDLWGLAQRYDNTAFINGIRQEYERLIALNEPSENP